MSNTPDTFQIPFPLSRKQKRVIEATFKIDIGRKYLHPAYCSGRVFIPDTITALKPVSWFRVGCWSNTSKCIRINREWPLRVFPENKEYAKSMPWN